MLIGVSTDKVGTTKGSALKTVLGLLVASTTLTLVAESPTSPRGELSHSLANLELTLKNEKQQCELHVQSKSSDKDSRIIPLLLEAPCYWVVSSESKELLNYSYKSADADYTLLVAGTPLDWSADKKAYQKLPLDTYCTQYLQGVVLSKGQTFAVDEKMIAAHCESGLAIDEKIFYAIAHNPVRYQDRAGISSEPLAQPKLTKTVETESKATPENPEDKAEKSFLDSVTDTVKDFFSGKSEDTK